MAVFGGVNYFRPARFAPFLRRICTAEPLISIFCLNLYHIQLYSCPCTGLTRSGQNHSWLEASSREMPSPTGRWRVGVLVAACWAAILPGEMGPGARSPRADAKAAAGGRLRLPCRSEALLASAGGARCVAGTQRLEPSRHVGMPGSTGTRAKVRGSQLWLRFHRSAFRDYYHSLGRACFFHPRVARFLSARA